MVLAMYFFRNNLKVLEKATIYSDFQNLFLGNDFLTRQHKSQSKVRSSIPERQNKNFTNMYS